MSAFQELSADELGRTHGGQQEVGPLTAAECEEYEQQGQSLRQTAPTPFQLWTAPRNPSRFSVGARAQLAEKYEQLHRDCLAELAAHPQP